MMLGCVTPPNSQSRIVMSFTGACGNPCESNTRTAFFTRSRSTTTFVSCGMNAPLAPSS